jgi:hypothetical protein
MPQPSIPCRKQASQRSKKIRYYPLDLPNLRSKKCIIHDNNTPKVSGLKPIAQILPTKSFSKNNCELPRYIYLCTNF